MTAYVFDVTRFRADFPAFANATDFPTPTLQMYWDTAGCIMDNDDYNCWAFEGECRERGLYLLTAHLTALSVIIAGGQIPGIVTQATIDKVSVTLMPPLVDTQLQQWFCMTPYGMQLYAMLQAAFVGGFYIGGLPELSAFRKVGGVF